MTIRIALSAAHSRRLAGQLSDLVKARCHTDESRKRGEFFL